MFVFYVTRLGIFVELIRIEFLQQRFSTCAECVAATVRLAVGATASLGPFLSNSTCAAFAEVMDPLARTVREYVLPRYPMSYDSISP